MIKPPGALGVITTQNAGGTGTATSRSAVELDVTGCGCVGIQTKGTYTGALSGQITIDGATWVTLAATTTFTNQADGTTSATIASGTEGAFVASVIGARRFRVTGLAAMTGTVAVSLQGADLP